MNTGMEPTPSEVLAEYNAIVDRIDRDDPEADFVMRVADYRVLRAALAEPAAPPHVDMLAERLRAEAHRTLDHGEQLERVYYTEEQFDQMTAVAGLLGRMLRSSQRNLAVAQERNLMTCCIYCGWTVRYGSIAERLDRQQADVLRHILTCDKRPERRLEERIAELRQGLTDALILLEGWINRYCVPKHRAEHLADLEKKRAVL